MSYDDSVDRLRALFANHIARPVLLASEHIFVAAHFGRCLREWATRRFEAAGIDQVLIGCVACPGAMCNTPRGNNAGG